jgi:hypothetical protein
VNTIDSRVAHSPLSRRAKFDLATLVTAGAASTIFFLLPVWTSLNRSSLNHSSPSADVPSLMRATIDTHPPVPTERPRTAIHRARAPKPTPEFVQAKADIKPAQSRLSRFFLGDGSDRVQPFPLADRRADR